MGLIDLIESKMGMNIVAIDAEEISSAVKYVVIVTATSLVHSKSLTKYLTDYFEQNDFTLYKKHPDTNNPWVLIDAKDIVVHIFLKETREFYSLEKLYFKGKTILS